MGQQEDGVRLFLVVYSNRMMVIDTSIRKKNHNEGDQPAE